MAKEKLCYILPIYDANTATHYNHLYELLEMVSESLDIFLITLSFIPNPKIGHIRNYHCIQERFYFFKALEYTYAILKARLKGYKKFYIHYQTFPAMIAIIVTKLMGGKTFIWSCVEPKAYFADWCFSFSALRRKLSNDIPLTIVLRSVDYLVTCSNFMAEYFRLEFRIDASQILVLPNWVNLSRFKPQPEVRQIIRKQLGISQETRVVLYAHTISRHRGCHLLCEIAETVHRNVPETIFLIVGDGPYREELLQEITRRKLNDIVRYLGKVPNVEIPIYFMAADIFINPTLREAFGRVLLESMAMGVPFVSTNGGGGVIAFTTDKQQEYIVRPGNVDTFAIKIIELLKSPQKRFELIQDGLKQVKNYSLEKTSVRFVELIVNH